MNGVQASCLANSHTLAKHLCSAALVTVKGFLVLERDFRTARLRCRTNDEPEQSSVSCSMKHARCCSSRAFAI